MSAEHGGGRARRLTGGRRTALCVAIQFHPEMGKLIYCSRTVGEIEKALEELKRLILFREKELGTPADFTAVGLTSRRNLCLHERARASVLVARAAHAVRACA